MAMMMNPLAASSSAPLFEGLEQLALGELERRLRQAGLDMVAGLDEAGRGALAGPVVAAAAILPAELTPFLEAGVRDSKLVPEKRREELYELVAARAVAFGVGIIGPREIDRINILQATRLAMQRALETLPHPPVLALVDGRTPFPTALPQRCIVAGDRRVLSIAAASIIAKVSRDRLMRQADGQFPGYGFARHKGYGTATHLEALRRLGPSDLHRQSFAPLSQVRLC